MFIKSALSIACVMACIGMSVSALAEAYNPYDVGVKPDGELGNGDPNADWMPMGLLRGYDSENLLEDSGYGVYLNSVAIAPLSSERAARSKILPLSYRQATDFLPFVRGISGDPSDLKNMESLTEDFKNDFTHYTEYPAWHSADWTRNYVVQVATALTKTKYIGATEYTPYERNGNGMGMDCSTFTTFVYNYALGHRFTGAVKAQGGQIVSEGSYKTPNQEPTAASLFAGNAAGTPLCENGELADKDTGCGVDVNGNTVKYISSFDQNGLRNVNKSGDTSGYFNGIKSKLNVGDLVYFSWEYNANNLNYGKINHVGIWSGSQIIVHASISGNSYPIAKVYEDYNFDRVWGVRRVITDDPSQYLNKDPVIGDNPSDSFTSGSYLSGSNDVQSTTGTTLPLSAVATNSSGDRVVAYESGDTILVDIYKANSDKIVRLPVHTAAGKHKNPDIDIDVHGKVVVVWQDDADDNGYYEVSMSVLDINETQPVISQQVTVNSVSWGQQLEPAVTIMGQLSGTSQFVIAWQDDKDQNDFYQIMASGYDLSADNIVTDGSFMDRIINEVDSGQQRDPDVDMDEYGNFVVVWEDDRDNDSYANIAVRGFWANGNARFPTQIANQYTAYQQLNPKVAVAANRVKHPYVVTWEDDYDNNGIYQIRAKGYYGGTQNGSYDGIVSSTFSDMTVNSAENGDQVQPAIAIDSESGDFMIAWKDSFNGKVTQLARGFKENGLELIADFEMSPPQLSVTESVTNVSGPQIDFVDIEKMVSSYSFKTTDEPDTTTTNLDVYSTLIEL